MSRVSSSDFVLRPATLADAETLLRWRNDPETRRASRETAPVTKREHLEWLAKSLESPTRKLRVVEQSGCSVGVVRADYVDGVHELSWTVAPEARGRGIGKRMVAEFVRELEGPIQSEVRKDNASSAKIAEFVGMQLVREAEGVLYYSRG